MGTRWCSTLGTRRGRLEHVHDAAGFVSSQFRGVPYASSVSFQYVWDFFPLITRLSGIIDLNSVIDKQSDQSGKE